MYAVFAAVEFTDVEAALKTLGDEVIPNVSSAPGFVAGYWVRLHADHGNSIVVFETEEQARVGMPEVGGTSPGVTFTSVSIGEVAGHA